MSNTTNGSLPIYPAYDLQAIADYQSLGYLDVAFFCELVCVNIVLLVLVIIFRNREPLKSRGIVPPFALVLLLISNLARIPVTFIPLVGVYALVPIQVGAITLVWALVVMQYVRFLIKQHREYTKQNSSNTTIWQRIVNFAVVSNVGLFLYCLLVTFVVGLVMMGMWLSIFATATFTVTALAVIVIFLAMEVCFSAFLIILDLIVDVYRFGIFTGTYTLRDPLNFKVDGIILLVCCSLNVIYMIFSQVSQGYITTEGITKRYLGLYAPTIFLDHAMRWCLLLISGGACMIIIFKRMILSLLPGRNNKKLSRAELLNKLWSMEEGRLAIMKYCEAEFSLENYKAYDDLQKFKDVKDPEEKVKLAHHIYNSYIGNASSLLLVNASQTVKASVTENMLKLPNDSSQALETIFDDFEIEVKTNLQDTFGRFMFSEAYAMYKRRRSSFDRYTKQ